MLQEDLVCGDVGNRGRQLGLTASALVLSTFCVAAAPDSQAAETPAATDAEASSAATDDEAGPRQVLLLDLKAQNVDEASVKSIDGLIATELSRHTALSVATGTDVREIMNLESEKVLAGCSDEDSSCLAEIAGALGAELVIFGQVGKLDRLLLLTLNIYDNGTARVVNRVTVQADSLDAVPAVLRQAIPELIAPVVGDGQVTPMASTDAEPADGAGLAPIITAAAGGGGLIIGGAALTVGLIPWLQYRGDRDRLQSFESEHGARPDEAALVELAGIGASAETNRRSWNSWGWPTLLGGVALASAGATALGLGIVWFVMSPSSEQSEAVE